MGYPKKIMTIREMEELGFSRKELMYLYRMRPDLKIAWKGAHKNSPIRIDTERYEKYRQSKCTGR